MPAMLRHKVKVLADPTAVRRFPFHAPLHEHATTFLAQKHRGLLVARRMLKQEAAHRRRSMLPTPGPDRTGTKKLGAGTLTLTKVKPRTGARLSILFWSLIIVLPEFLQGYLIDMASGALTVLVLLVARAISTIEAHWKTSTGVAFGCIVIGVVGYLARSHKARSDVKYEDDEDEDDDDVNGEAR